MDSCTYDENIALVYSFDESNWFSCTKIIANLIRAYNLIDQVQLTYHNLSSRIDVDLTNLAQEIDKAKPQKIIFLDHSPHPLKLITEINRQMPNFTGEFLFHIFGDFTLMFDSWMQMEDLICGKNVKFFCASDRQVALLRQFVTNKKIVQKIPFPVDKEEFYFQDQKNKLKSELGFNSKDKLLIYTGRLSLQKNIHLLCEEFLHALKTGTLSMDYKLVIVGEVDALGFPFAGEFHVLGEYFRFIDKVIKKHDEKLQKRILFTGKIPNKKLLSYYQAADYFISLSTYHDEDYGMSVAEAGCCGLPLILTRWAGFASFDNENTHFVGTQLVEKGPKINLNDLQNIFFQINQYSCDGKNQSDFYIKKYSIQAIAKVIEIEIKKDPTAFSGFSSLLFEMGRIKLNGKFLFYNLLENKMTKKYYQVYGVYAG